MSADEIPAPSGPPGAASRRCPFPAKVLLAWAVASAVARLATACGGLEFHPRYGDVAQHGAALATALSVGFAALVLATLGTVVVRRRWGHGLFVAVWVVRYGLELVVHLPAVWAIVRVDRDGHSIGNLCQLVVGGGVWTVIVVSYLLSAPARRWFGGPRAEPSGARAARRAGTLPFAAKAVAILVAGWGVGQLMLAGPAAVRYSLGQGPVWLYAMPGWHRLWGLAEPYGYALAGTLGLVAGPALLCRRSWARWVLIAGVWLEATNIVGSASAMASLVATHTQALTREDVWELAVVAATSFGYALFLSAYVASGEVRAAMLPRRRGEGGPA